VVRSSIRASTNHLLLSRLLFSVINHFFTTFSLFSNLSSSLFLSFILLIILKLPLVAIHPQNRSFFQTAPDRISIEKAIGSLSTAALAKKIGIISQKQQSSGIPNKSGDINGSSKKTNNKDMNKEGFNNASEGSGSDSEGPIDIAHQPSNSSSSSSSSSSSNKSSSGSESSSSSATGGGGGNSSSGSGSEPMGPVRIVSTTESPSATSGGSGSGGGSSSDGGKDDIVNVSSTKSLVITPYKKTSGKQTDNELPNGPVLNVEGWRAHLEIRRARGKLTERKKKAREQAILALSLNFPSSLSSSSSSSSSPSLFAIISLAGKQFKVSPGDIVIADRLKNIAVSSELSLSPHIVGSPTRTLVGRPVVQGASVICIVESHELDEKVIVFKKKRRKRYQRTQGHRREISRIRIDKIVCDVEKY
jgi:ribosomal protein L21